MKIELELEEINCLMNALNLARRFYEKTNQIDRAREAQQVHDLLTRAQEIHAHVHTEHMTESGRQEYLEILRKRETRLKGDGKVVELYQYAPDDEDDPDQVSADRDIGRVAREWAKEKKDGK